MADKGPYGKVRGGKMKEGTPELCRSGTMPPGSSELNRGAGSVPGNSELCRPGTMPATMPELDRRGFRGGPFVDRTSENERMVCDGYNKATGGSSDSDLTPGHKKMAGMT
jgi:hypothetical protein